MKRENYKKGLHFCILYIVLIISIVTNIISNNNIIIGKKTELIKTMDETTEVANLNNTINTLNASHTEYSNYIQTSKANLATAITNAGVTTSGEATFETMITNVSKILSNKTNDATATADQILTGQTAYVKGNKVTGTMANKGAVTATINAGGSYTIPEGYHNGNGKVTANISSGVTFVTCVPGKNTTPNTDIYNGKCSFTFSESGSYLIVYFLECHQNESTLVTITKNTEEITDYYYQKENSLIGAGYRDIFVYFEVDCSSGDILEIESAGYGMMMAVFKN